MPRISRDGEGVMGDVLRLSTFRFIIIRLFSFVRLFITEFICTELAFCEMFFEIFKRLTEDTDWMRVMFTSAFIRVARTVGARFPEVGVEKHVKRIKSVFKVNK